MFLHLSVSHSVHRGSAWQGGVHGRGVCIGRGVCMVEGCAWQGRCMVGGVCGRGAYMPGDTATAADGTHPTGMHSCLHMLIFGAKFSHS